MNKYSIFLACLALFFVACHSAKTEDHSTHDHEKESPAEHQAHAAPESDESHAEEILFSKAHADKVGLEVTEMKPTSFHSVIKTSGQILAAQGDEMNVVATTSGVVSISKKSLSEGSSVKLGESLFSISAKNIAAGDPVAKASITFQLAKTEFERAQLLIKEKLISQKEYEQILLIYQTAEVAYQAFSHNQSTKGITISAPMSGFVKTKLAQEGDYVEVGQPLLSITQNRRLQLRVDVSERYYNQLSSIESAHFKTPYDNQLYRLSELNGRLLSYGKSAREDAFYIPVTFEFDNIETLVSGAFVDVFLLSKSTEQAIVVPLASLIEEQGFYSVYIQLDEEGYRKQEVKLGANDGQRVLIQSGIKKGDQVVTKGAHYIKLAASSSAIPVHQH